MNKRIGWPKLLGRIAWVIGVDQAVCGLIWGLWTFNSSFMASAGPSYLEVFLWINGVAAGVAIAAALFTVLHFLWMWRGAQVITKGWEKMSRKLFTTLFLGATLLSADTLLMKDGREIPCQFLGGNARSVQVEIEGQVRSYDVSEVGGISFTQQAPSTAQSSAYVPSDSGKGIPANTSVVIRLIDPVDSKTDSLGQSYRASIDQPIYANGLQAVPRGADAVLKLVDSHQAGRFAGKTALTLRLDSFVMNGHSYEVLGSDITKVSSSRTGRSAEVIGGAAALGALVGGLAGGGTGAAIGAGSGAAIGTGAQVFTPGQRIKLPSESRLTFTLTQPVSVP